MLILALVCGVPLWWMKTSPQGLQVRAFEMQCCCGGVGSYFIIIIIVIILISADEVTGGIVCRLSICP